MAQLSFASLDYAAKKKRTKRDVFLAEMAAVVPWVALEEARPRDALIEEGQPVVLWHEGPHRCRCDKRARAHCGRDHRQCA